MGRYGGIVTSTYAANTYIVCDLNRFYNSPQLIIITDHFKLWLSTRHICKDKIFATDSGQPKLILCSFFVSTSYTVKLS